MSTTYVEPVPGGHFRDWRIVRPLGAGGCGQVFEVEWDSDVAGPPRDGDLRAAAKVAHPGMPALAEAMLNEARALLALEPHPHLVRAFDGFRDQTTGVTVLVMELADGDLSDEAPMAGPRVLAAAREVAAGLAHLHRVGKVHNDLKLDNVLRCGGRWKLSDFGIAVELGEATHGYAPLANMWLRPPEAVRDFGADGSPRVRPTWDTWAFGLMMHLLVTGRDPRPGARAEARFHAAIRGEVAVDPTIEAHLRRVIERCLAIDPADRISDGAALAAALGPVPAGAGAQQPDPAPRLAPAPRPAFEPAPAPKPAPPPRSTVRCGPVAAATRADLARSIVERWDEVATALAAADVRRRLADDAAQVWGAELPDLPDGWVSGARPGANRRVAELVAALDPSRPPSVAGVPIGSSDLMRLAAGAIEGARDDVRLLDVLFDGRVLAALARHDGCEDLAELDAAWHRQWADYAGMRAKAAVPSLNAPRARLLSALISDAFAAGLATEARRARLGATGDADLLAKVDRSPAAALVVLAKQRHREAEQRKVPPRPPSAPRPHSAPRRRPSVLVRLVVALLVAAAVGGGGALVGDRMAAAERDDLAASFTAAVAELGEVDGPGGVDVASVTPWTASEDGCIYHVVNWKSLAEDGVTFVDRGESEVQVRACAVADGERVFAPSAAPTVEVKRRAGALRPYDGGTATSYVGDQVVRVDVNLVPPAAAAVAAFVVALAVLTRRASRRSRSRAAPSS